MKRQAAFTMIELMVVIVILGILASIALPSYSNFVRKAARSEATTLLSTLAQEQEIFYISNTVAPTRNYGVLNAGFAPLNYAAATISIDKDGNLGVAGTGLYDVTVTANNATIFTMTATATNAQLEDTDCRVFTITSTGAQTAVNAAAVDTSAKCW